MNVIEKKQVHNNEKNIPFAKLLEIESDEKKAAKTKENREQVVAEKKQTRKKKTEEKTVSYKKNPKYSFKIKDHQKEPYVMTYAGPDNYFEDADSWRFGEHDFIRWIIREDKDSMTELMGESDYLVGLPYPLEIGNTFETVDGVSEITDLGLEISIKAGTFTDVVEMSGEGVKTYFAPDAGRIFSIGSDGKTYYELLEMKKR